MSIAILYLVFINFTEGCVIMEFGAMNSFMPFLKAMVEKPSSSSLKNDNTYKTNLSNSIFSDEISAIKPIQKNEYTSKSENNIFGENCLANCSACSNRRICKKKTNEPVFANLLHNSINSEREKAFLEKNNIQIATKMSSSKFNFSVGTIDRKSVGRTLNKVI